MLVPWSPIPLVDYYMKHGGGLMRGGVFTMSNVIEYSVDVCV